MAISIKKILKLSPDNRFRMLAKLKRNQRIRKSRNSLFRLKNVLDNYVDGRKEIDPSVFRAEQWRIHSLKRDIDFRNPLITAQFFR